MEYYNLGNSIKAFTTDRTIGRDREKIMSLLLPLSPDRFFYPHQTHTDNVMKVDADFFLLPETERKERGEGVDAVISNVTGACLGISTADCIPVLVYDPQHHAAAAIHAGWRGTVARIVRKAVEAMQREYGTVPQQCRAAIGPGISQESFEVGWEVHQNFLDNGFVMDEVTVVMPEKNGVGVKPHIDLKEVNRRELMAVGLSPENIEVSGIDTFTDERFFSARREQKGTQKCGRILSGFVLN